MGPENDDLNGLVSAFAEADMLGSLPDVVDVRARAPQNPPAVLQQKFVGASMEPAYAEAGRFVGQAIEWASATRPIGTQSRVLDFGAGWGRISRMLLSAVPSQRLYAVDVDQRMIALIGSTLPGVNCLVGEPYPPSVLADRSMTHAFAFSVFSHLSEPAHAAWAAEFGRLIAPGGLVFLTVLDGLFFLQVASCQAEVAAGEPSPFAQNLATVLADPVRSHQEYDEGRFIYSDGGADGARSGGFYGWAAAPRPWLDQIWGSAGFRIVHWVPSGVLFEQAMVCLRRTDRPLRHQMRHRLRGALRGMR